MLNLSKGYGSIVTSRNILIKYHMKFSALHCSKTNKRTAFNNRNPENVVQLATAVQFSQSFVHRWKSVPSCPARSKTNTHRTRSAVRFVTTVLINGVNKLTITRSNGGITTRSVLVIEVTSNAKFNQSRETHLKARVALIAGTLSHGWHCSVCTAVCLGCRMISLKSVGTNRN